MAVVDGETFFCETCPAQGDYAGSVENATSVVKVEIVKGHDNSQGYGPKVDLYANVLIQLADEDRVPSAAAEAFVRIDAIEGIEPPARKENGEFRDRRRFVERLEKKVENITPDLQQRIGRCAHSSVDEHGKLTCPAMSSAFMKQRLTES